MGNPIQYRVHFQGSNILDAAVETLRRENGTVTYTDAKMVQHSMPDLDSADIVLLAGSSAGAEGVVQTVDRLAPYLMAQNGNCRGTECPLLVGAVIDAAYQIANEDLGYKNSTACMAQKLCSYQEFVEHRWTNIVNGFWEGRVDESCVSFHQPTVDQWKCAEPTHALEHHILTPMYIRMDLQDWDLLNQFIQGQFELDGETITATTFGQKIHDQLVDLANINLTAEEGAMMAVPGVFGPQCGDHASFTNTVAFLNTLVEAEDNNLYSAVAILSNWITGMAPSAAIVDFQAPGLLPSCPLNAFFLDGFESGM